MAFFVMIAFVLVPLSASAEREPDHAIEAAVCADVSASDGSAGHSPDHEGHVHSAHHCGSCHVHLISSAVSSSLALDPFPRHVTMASNDQCTGLEFGGLYRPPRV